MGDPPNFSDPPPTPLPPRQQKHFYEYVYEIVEKNREKFCQCQWYLIVLFYQRKDKYDQVQL
jgi:hypothetical protein